jgi:hypothetical protein
MAARTLSDSDSRWSAPGSLGSLRLLVLSHGDRYLEGLPTYGAALERLWLQGGSATGRR